MRLLGIQATRFLDIALDEATLLAVLVERLAHDLGGDGNGKVCNRGGSSCVDSVTLVLGIGMGLGFTLALLLIGSIREILGSGTWFGIPLTVNLFDPVSIFVLAPGGFLVYGFVIATVNKLTSGKAIKKKEFGCEGCPNAASCGSCSGCSSDKKGE